MRMAKALRRTLLALVAGLVAALAAPPAGAGADVTVRAYAVPAGGHPHDVAVGAEGIVWYTAQRSGHLGRLDPATGAVELIALGPGAAPHGVVVGPDGAPWVTEGGTNAIVRVDPRTRAVRSWPLPAARPSANLNTLTFDRRGRVWFTGQTGVYGRLDPATGAMQVWDAPRGRVWVSEWNSGNVSRYDPPSRSWRTWKLPGERPRAYAVYVDDRDTVWLSDWGANAMVRFDPETETFEVFPGDRRGAAVRQILGRPGEVWAPESGTDRLVVYRYRAR